MRGGFLDVHPKCGRTIEPTHPTQTSPLLANPYPSRVSKKKKTNERTDTPSFFFSIKNLSVQCTDVNTRPYLSQKNCARGMLLARNHTLDTPVSTEPPSPIPTKPSPSALTLAVTPQRLIQWISHVCETYLLS